MRANQYRQRKLSLGAALLVAHVGPGRGSVYAGRGGPDAATDVHGAAWAEHPGRRGRGALTLRLAARAAQRNAGENRISSRGAATAAHTRPRNQPVCVPRCPRGLTPPPLPRRRYPYLARNPLLDRRQAMAHHRAFTLAVVGALLLFNVPLLAQGLPHQAVVPAYAALGFSVSIASDGNGVAHVAFSRLPF